MPVSGKSSETQTGPVLAPGIRRGYRFGGSRPVIPVSPGPLPGPRSAQGAALLAFMAGADRGLFLAAAVGPERAHAVLSPARRQRSRVEPGKAGPVVLCDELSRPARQPGERSGVFALSGPEPTMAGRNRIARRLPERPWAVLPFAILGLDDPRDSEW